jgi:hypothetical protein
MYSIKTHMLLVCLMFAVTTSFGRDVNAWIASQADCPYCPENFSVPAMAPAKPITKVKPSNRIMKCKPLFKGATRTASSLWDFRGDCILPIAQHKGWEANADVLFARIKGKARFATGAFATFGMAGFVDDIDLNSDLGVPEHGAVGTYSIAYRFRPNWRVRYSIMPMIMNGSGQPGRSVIWGHTSFNSNQNLSVKWERLQQSVALVYDPIMTPSSRLSLSGGYLRINERLGVFQPGCCGSPMDNDLNMGLAAFEFERCLRQTRTCNTLSLQCGAGVAFGDDGFGSDVSTGLKYSIPLNSGRWGYVKGGYRFMSYKKKYSDVKMFETAMEGGFLQMGFVF